MRVQICSVSGRRVVIGYDAPMHLRTLCLLFVFLASCSECGPAGPNLGLDPTIPAGPGEVRAGVVRADGPQALFGGILAEGRVGDIKIYNNRVQFIIASAERRHGIVDTGGYVIDADLVRPDGMPGRDLIEELFTAFGFGRLVEAETVEIINDGGDGNPAEIRVFGHDVPWSFLQGAFELPEPIIPDLGLEVEIRYTLAPDSHVLVSTVTWTNTYPNEVAFRPTFGFSGSFTERRDWSNRNGLAPDPSQPAEVVGIVGRWGEAVMTLHRPDGLLDDTGLSDIVPAAGLSVFEADDISLEPGAQAALEAYWTLANDTTIVTRNRFNASGSRFGSVQGVIRDDQGGVAGVRVHLVDQSDGAPVGFAVSSDDGAYSIDVGPGTYDVYAVGRGPNERTSIPAAAGRYAPFSASHLQEAQLALVSAAQTAPALSQARGRAIGVGGGVTVTDGAQETVDIVLDASSRLEMTIRDGQGMPIPALVRLHPQFDRNQHVPTVLRSALGLTGGSYWFWTHTGSISEEVVPGVYDIEVRHSVQHDEYVDLDVQFDSGQSTAVDVVLQEVVGRDGWLNMDLHLHAAPSSDGKLTMEERVIVCAALGIDLPIATDHDRHTDYRPLISALGIDGLVQSIPGSEVSPLSARGHFNGIDIPQTPNERNGGALRWWEGFEDTQELFDRIHENNGPEALLQVNHGRTYGMMDAALYNPATGIIGRPDRWSWDFDLFELVNGGSPGNWEDERADFFSWLNQGILRTPTGVSDSHSRLDPCGSAMTSIFVGVDSVGDVSVDAIKAALLDGRVVVSNGPKLRADIDTGTGPVLPGETAIGSTGIITITVEAPQWIEPSSLRIYENGQIVHDETLPDASVGPVRYDDIFLINPTQDSWYAVEVEGTAPMGFVWGSTIPYAITNAILVDVDGDGWVPPGL